MDQQRPVPPVKAVPRPKNPRLSLSAAPKTTAPRVGTSKGCFVFGIVMVIAMGAAVGAGIVLGVGQDQGEEPSGVASSPTPFPNSIEASDAETNVISYSTLCHSSCQLS